MPKTGISAILVIGLLAGSVIGVVAQEDGSGQALAPDTGDLFCVRASGEVGAERLNEAVVAAEVTVTVVPDAECAPDTALDALSDGEHFGVFLGHFVDLVPSATAILDAWATVPQIGGRADLETWLADLAADPDVMAATLANLDRFVAWVDDELAWLEAHPPRPCYAGFHEAWRGWLDQAAAITRSFTLALRTQDVELLTRVMADIEAFDAITIPDMSSQTCWNM